MYYAMVKKNGEFGKWYKINVDGIDKAKKFVTTLISVKGLKKTVDNYIFKTDSEYDEFVLKNKKEEKDRLEEAIRLDPVAINILENVLELKYQYIDFGTIIKYNLKTNTHKPYYVKCYWSYDFNGSFCDLEDIEDMIYEKAISSRCDYSCTLEVYDAKTCEQLDIDVSVSVKINRK